MPHSNPILDATKYAGAWFEHGHPFNDAAYSLVEDAPLMAAQITRYEEVLQDMEAALNQTRAHLLKLVQANEIAPVQLSHVEAALERLRQTRRELEAARMKEAESEADNENAA